MITGLDYFYDGQQKRFLEQLVRAFSGFKYRTGYGRNGEPPRLMMVPCRIASKSRTVATIINNASENTLNAVPMITIHQAGLDTRFEDLQNVGHVDTRQVVERAIDADGKYTGERGQSYTVQRLMPLPFTMRVQVDVWTSNEDQKQQLEEQILIAIAPNFEIQSSDNPLDWTALTTVYLEGIEHSSRTIPVGTGGSDELDILTFQLRMPFWLSPPAKVQKQTLINQIVTNINDGGDVMPGQALDPSQGQRLSQSVVTPGDHYVRIDGNRVYLLGKGGVETDSEGNKFNWMSLIDQMGDLRPTMSQLAISTTNNIEDTKIVGTLQVDENNPNALFWQIDPDTLPKNTLDPVNAVIEPLRTFPGERLPVAANGQRYLILDDIGPSVAWGPITAKAGNIIQYHNDAWTVVFNGTGTAPEHVLNLNSGSQLRWNGSDWIMAIDGEYAPGMWRLWL